MITRRGFFGLLGSALAAEAARKVYVFAPKGGWNIQQGEALFFNGGSEMHLPFQYRDAYRNEITGTSRTRLQILQDSCIRLRTPKGM